MQKREEPSIIFLLFTSQMMRWIFTIAGFWFIYFMSDKDDPLNKGTNGNGSWNLWTGIIMWVLVFVSQFAKNKIITTSIEDVIEEDDEIKKIDQDLAQIASSYKPYLKKREEDPEFWKKLVDSGLINDDDIKDSENIKEK